MIIINYVTKNTPYVSVLNKFLLPSLQRFNLPHDIEYIEDLKSWSLNTNYKCTHIKQMLLKHKQSVCFIDADGEILQHPSLLYQLEDYDIAFHFSNWYHLWRNQPENTTKMDLLSGTLYFNYNENTLAFLDQCIENIKNSPQQWEQTTIQKTLEAQNKLKIKHLPFSYCTVLKQDNSIPEHMIKKEDVVVLHHQASRQYKNRRLWPESNQS